MRTTIAIATLLAIGLLWSVAAMSGWVPVVSTDATLATLTTTNHSTH